MGFYKELTLMSAAILLTGCCATMDTAKSEESHASPAVCSAKWLMRVDERVITGDDSGHGPDIGSLEWRSVIAHRLGLHSNKALPARDSNDWCHYIDEQIEW